MTPRRILFALTPVLLAACTTVGPDYQRPVTELPASYAVQSDSEASARSNTQSAGLANTSQDSLARKDTLASKDALAIEPLRSDWWTLFEDPQLNALVQAALTRNTDLRAAVARIEEADALAREAGAALLPNLNLGATGGRLQAKNLLVPNSVVRSNNLQLNALAAYEIDFWGKVQRSNEAARAQALASRHALDVLRLTSAGAVSQAWFSLRALDEQIELTRATVQARQRQRELLALRVEAGTSGRLDLEQATVALADASIQVRELQRQRALVQTLLGRLTGQPGLMLPSVTPAGAITADSLSRLPVPAQPPVGLPSMVLLNRPDIAQAEQALIAANAQIGVARAALLPSISLTAGYGAQSSALASLLNNNARIWSLGFGLSLPIFDGGRLQARVDQSSARQQQALAAYQGAIEQAFREVSDALTTGSTARAQEVDLQTRVSASERALQLSMLRYEAGYSAYLEVLDAQRTLNSASLDAIRNRLARLNATVELFKALSGGWMPADDAKSSPAAAPVRNP